MHLCLLLLFIHRMIAAPCIKGKCEGADKNGVPIRRSKVQFYECLDSYENPSFRIHWNSPSENLSKLKSYQIIVSIESNESIECFKCSRNESRFVFGRQQGMDSSMDYQVAVVPLPALANMIHTPFTKIGRCPSKGPTLRTGTFSITASSPISTMDNTLLPTSSPIPTVDNTHLPTSLPILTVDNTFLSTLSPVNNEVKYLIAILVGICTAVAILLMLIICYKRGGLLRRFFTSTFANIAGGDSSGTGNIQSSMAVYLSHCAVDNKDKEKVLQLSSFMSLYGISVCIDLCSQVEINRMGGLPHWVPEKMSSVDKIVLVLTPSYLQAISSNGQIHSETLDQVCKVNTEFNYINTFLYHSCQREPKLVVLLNGVNRHDVPAVCKGRLFCRFPNKINKDDEDCIHLIGLLLDIEPTQIIENSHCSAV